jgi:hypothetical protein
VAKDGLSVIACDNQIPVGFILNLDFSDPFYQEMKNRFTLPSTIVPKIILHTCTDMKELVDCSENWYLQNYLTNYKLKYGDILLVEAIGVKPDLMGKGIAQTMIKACVELGQKEQFKRIFFQSINSISTHIFQKNGFKLLKSIDYDKFTLKDGTIPFSDFKKAFPTESSFDILELVYDSKFKP